MKRAGLALLFSFLLPALAHAQGAPGMYDVGEVIVDNAHFDDAKTSDRCGVSRDMVAQIFVKAFADTSVTAIPIADAKPPMLGIARIQLIPQISTFTDDSLDCMSWISLTAQSKASVIIPPVPSARDVTIVYSQQHDSVFSGQSIHAQRVTEILQKMAAQFAQQYKADQPPSPLGK